MRADSDERVEIYAALVVCLDTIQMGPDDRAGGEGTSQIGRLKCGDAAFFDLERRCLGHSGQLDSFDNVSCWPVVDWTVGEADRGGMLARIKSAACSKPIRSPSDHALANWSGGRATRASARLACSRSHEA